MPSFGWEQFINKFNVRSYNMIRHIMKIWIQINLILMLIFLLLRNQISVQDKQTQHIIRIVLIKKVLFPNALDELNVRIISLYFWQYCNIFYIGILVCQVYSAFNQHLKEKNDILLISNDLTNYKLTTLMDDYYSIIL